MLSFSPMKSKWVKNSRVVRKTPLEYKRCMIFIWTNLDSFNLKIFDEFCPTVLEKRYEHSRFAYFYTQSFAFIPEIHTKNIFSLRKWAQCAFVWYIMNDFNSEERNLNHTILILFLDGNIGVWRKSKVKFSTFQFCSYINFNQIKLS